MENRKQTQGELIRGLIPHELKLDAQGEAPSPEMAEIVAVRLLLTNLFKSQLLWSTGWELNP